MQVKGIMGRRGALVAAAVMLASAVFGGGNAASAAEASLKVGIPGLNVSTVPLHYATSKGIFKANGIASVDTITGDAPTWLPGLKTGSLDIVTLATVNLLQAREQGLDVVYICGVYPVLPLVALTNDKNLQDLKQAGDWQAVLKQLKGKLVGVPALGTGIDVGFRAALKQMGMEPDKDVRIVAVATNAALGALRSGQVDVTWAPPFVDAQVVAGGGKALLAGSDIPGGGVVNGAWAAMRSWVESNREAAAGFCKSYGQAIQAATDPANISTTKEILKSNYKLDDASLDGAVQSLKSFISADIPQAALEASFKLVVERGQAKAVVPYDQAVLKP